MPNPPKKDAHIPELDGVRGIAILLVLLFHFQGHRPDSVPRVLGLPFSLGWSGVDLFFVLSGFLITGILLDSRHADNYFAAFYARRVLRIFPLYLLTIFAYFEIVLPIAHHFGQWQSLNGDLQIWYWLHLSNWRSAFGHDVPLLSHIWSLSIEEQFYFIWPMVVLFVEPTELAYVCLMLMGAALFLRGAFANSLYGFDFLYRLTPFRMDSLAAGSLIALLVRDAQWFAFVKSRLGRLTFAAVSMLLLVLFFSSRTSSTSAPLTTTVGYTAFGLAYGCLVFFAYCYSGSSMWRVRTLRSRFLRALGKYSYAIYIIHVPIAIYQTSYVARISQGLPAGTQIALWLLSIAFGGLVSFALALASWHLLEKHFLRLKHWFVVKYQIAPREI